MSHVHVSFEGPEYTANADGIGTLRILEAVRLLGLTKKIKIYQAATSELYGLVQAVKRRCGKKSKNIYSRFQWQ
jgi:GDPmannose 4,6-dehydratase